MNIAETKREIEQLGLPHLFKEVLNGTLRREFRSLWAPPKRYFAICNGLESRVPQLNGMCPLLEINGESVLGILGKHYVRFYFEDCASLEDPKNGIELLGNNYQQFATHLLIEIEEAGLISHYFSLAEALEYRHTAKLRELLDRYKEHHDESELLNFKLSLI